MSDLQSLIDDFDYIKGIAHELSQQFDGVQTPDRRKKLSTYYLAKVVPECISLLRVLPSSRYTGSGELLDFPSFCSILRNLIEAANLHWYYCIESADAEQSEFRFLLYYFHDSRTTIQFGNFLGADEAELASLRRKCDELKMQIKESSVFRRLHSEAQRQILKGRKCSDLNQTEISSARGIDVDFFNGIYKLLSNNTHSTPASISAVVHSRVHGQAMQEALACLILSYTSSFVADMVKTIGDSWGLVFDKEESEAIIRSYSRDLTGGT